MIKMSTKSRYVLSDTQLAEAKSENLQRFRSHVFLPHEVGKVAIVSSLGIEIVERQNVFDKFFRHRDVDEGYVIKDIKACCNC